MSQVGGAAAIEYTIIGGNAANFGVPAPTSTFEGSAIPSTNTSIASGWTPAKNGSISQQTYWNALVNWAGQVGTIAGSEHVLASSDTKSFSAFFGTGDRLAGAFPLRMSSTIDTNLFLLGRNFLPAGSQVAQSALGAAMLTVLAGTGNGQLTFAASAVPLPAAVVLFGSGLIGLIGIARRKFTQAQA
jgi:enamine deaminase RidA (YjgF/YER057c/UK114 family)